MRNILFGLLTIITLLGIGYLLSDNKKNINVRTILSGLAAQLVMMFLVLKTSVGQWVLKGISDGILKVLSFSQEGITFVFGGISPNFVFAINVLAVICFTSALISALYYLKVIPFLVKHVGKVVGKIMGTTEVENFCAVGNMFLGGTEAPLLTKPYLKHLTRSELFAVMVGGFGSAAVSTILGYVSMGIDLQFILVQMATVPFSTLLMAKLLVPETEKSKTNNIEITKSHNSNIFDAIGEGAITGMHLAFNVGAVLIAFIGLMGLVNFILGFVGLDLTQIFAVLLTPLAWIMGIPGNEVSTFTNAIGLKTAVNEYVAIANLSNTFADLTLRTQAMLTIALVNFANFSVIGIMIGGFNAFCPEKAKEVSKLGFKAMIGGLLTTLISAAMVGMFL